MLMCTARARANAPASETPHVSRELTAQGGRDTFGGVARRVLLKITHSLTHGPQSDLQKSRVDERVLGGSSPER